MLLTSMRRLRQHLAGPNAVPITDETKNNRLIAQWLSSVSAQINGAINRETKIGAYTEYFDITYNKDEYYINAPPIIGDVTTVKSDPTGLFDGGEGDESDFHPGSDRKSVVLIQAMTWVANRGLQIVYNGGLADDPVKGVFVLTTGTATITNDWFVFGQTSGAVGIVAGWTLATKKLTVENYYGSFQDDEQIKIYDDEAQTTPKHTDTIVSFDEKALADVEPLLVKACETQIRYYWKHTTDFENASTSKETTTRRDPVKDDIDLQPEVTKMIEKYIRYS